jgi:copper chaperone NosL
MIVSDRRFGAQLVTRTGKAVTFDSISCLRTYLSRTRDAGETWVVDASNPGRLVREVDAQILADSATRPPMGTLYAVAR